MSLGQRQLICFTRAFLADPRIFMLDEATSAVDTATEMLVQRSLEKLLENRTTFVVAHRLSTIMRADNILVVDQGRVVYRESFQEQAARADRTWGRFWGWDSKEVAALITLLVYLAILHARCAGWVFTAAWSPGASGGSSSRWRGS